MTDSLLESISALIPDRIKLPDVVWKSIAQQGLTQIDILHKANINPVEIVRKGYYSTAEFFALWNSVQHLAGEPTVGLRIAQGIEGTAMPPSFMVAYHACDFYDALQRISRFKRLCSPETVKIDAFDDYCDVYVNWAYANSMRTPPALVDITLASFLELGRKGTHQPLSALRVELIRPADKALKIAFEDYFGCPVHFGAGRDCLRLHRDTLHTTFVAYNAELLNILLPALDNQLEQQRQETSLKEKVCCLIKHRLTLGRPDIRTIATELAMSERSLQRKLAGLGMTFQGLLNETRHSLALNYLTDPKLTLTEIAFMLGYEDQNSYFRAFHHWENLTPSEWRSRQFNP
ncbi:helix-turn-helix domain-containing protein [Serratia sp. L9]|uniref:AraC family transcriptional regulator n=1 Tax=Serratia sp. L9 TaxID=3423946 RepID=UPI003D67EA6C